MTSKMNRADMLDIMEYGARVLALPYDLQESVFGSAEGITEDLVEAWEDGICYLRLAGGGTPEQQKAVDLIDSFLSEFEPNDPFWLNQRLRSDPRWDTLRGMAKGLLASFGWAEAVPDISLRHETIIVVE